MKSKWYFLILVSVAGRIHAQNAKETTGESWSLQQCVDYAVTHNLTVKKASYTLQTSGLTYTQSRFERLPSLSASASHTMTNGTSIDPITSDFVSQLIQSSSFGLNAQVTLYNGGRLNNQIRQNFLATQRNQLYVEEAKNSIVLSVTEAYLRVQYYKESDRQKIHYLQLPDNWHRHKRDSRQEQFPRFR